MNNKASEKQLDFLNSLNESYVPVVLPNEAPLSVLLPALGISTYEDIDRKTASVLIGLLKGLSDYQKLVSNK